MLLYCRRGQPRHIRIGGTSFRPRHERALSNDRRRPFSAHRRQSIPGLRPERIHWPDLYLPGLAHWPGPGADAHVAQYAALALRSEEHTSELQSLMRISYAVFCLKKNNIKNRHIVTLQ